MMLGEAAMTALWLLLGLVAGGAFLAYAKRFGRAQRKVLAYGLVVAAIVYLLFAILGGRTDWLVRESLGIALYGLLAWLGLRHSSLWLAAGWALHPVWDALLHLVGPGAAFAPRWYVLACISFDLLVGASIFWNRKELQR